MQRGLTLAQVAERATLDVSTLSRIESGKRRLPLDLVAGLAAALEASTDELFAMPVTADPWVAGRPHRRHGITAIPLTRRFATELPAFRITLDPRTRREPPDPLPIHAGAVALHVLVGRMRLLLGPDEFIVAPGRTVEFGTATPHWFGVVDEPVEAIFVAGSGNRDGVGAGA